jgi:hypothetical protein
MPPSSTAWFSMTRNVQSMSRNVLRASSPLGRPFSEKRLNLVMLDRGHLERAKPRQDIEPKELGLARNSGRVQLHFSVLSQTFKNTLDMAPGPLTHGGSAIDWQRE